MERPEAALIDRVAARLVAAQGGAAAEPNGAASHIA